MLQRATAAGPLLVLVGALLLAVAPAWTPVWYQDDQLPTLFRTFHTDLAHHWGVLYPRLAPELGFGYGRLLHELYPPFGVELAAWLHTLGLGFVDAARATFSLCLISSCFGMYRFGLCLLGGRWSAALAAVGFLWAPYVLLDAHKGGVLGESVAMALMPWALLSLDRLVRTGSWGAFAASAGTLALVVLGHNITALFFVGLVSLYALLLALHLAATDSRATRPGADPERHPGNVGNVPAGSAAILAASSARPLARAAAAVLLAMALAAIYWLPALLELSYTRVSEQRSGEFTVTRYLVAPLDLLQPLAVFDYYVEAMPRYGLTAAILTLLALVLFVAASTRSCRQRPTASERHTTATELGQPDRLLVIAFGSCFVAVLLLQLRASAVVWETVPLISFVQFPQRLFVFGSFAGAVVLGSAPWAVRQLLGPRAGQLAGMLTWAVVAVVLGASSLPGIYWTYPVAGSHVIDNDDIGIGTVAERRLSERRAFDDYFPIWVEEDAGQITRPATSNRAEAYRSVSSGPVPRVEVVERGYLSTTLRSQSDTPATLVVHQFYFPGWQAEADGAPLTVGPAGPLGLVSLTIPPGEHLVRVWFGETPLRLTATGISVAALVVLLLVMARGLGTRRLALGVAVLLLVVGVPRLIHDRLEPSERPAVRAVNADVTPSARVVGLELAERPARPGELVPVTLLWQATTYTSRDLQTGLRLVAADGGKLVSERWGRPNRERTPTGKWIVGELVPDTLLLRIPNDAPPGRYRLLAGLRDPDASDRAPLGLVEIGALEVR